MANGSHHALIVGVSSYQEKGLGELKGATEDAARFYRWVRSATGGDVPEANVILLENPTIQRIEDAFRRICEPALATGYVGQRLYVYLAGHGVAQDVHEASLLAADGGLDARDRHVPGWHWLSWFLTSGYFSEVALFADCCRTVRGTWAVRRFPLDPVTLANQPQVSWVRGYAVQFGGIAFEQSTGEKSRGVFTDAFLDALEHARKPAPDDPKRWVVTARSVSDYLFNSPKLAEWRNYQAPSILVEGDLVLATGMADEGTRVVVQVREGETPTIHGGPQSRSWPVEPGGANEFIARLPRGLYAARVPGRTGFFAVTGGEQQPPPVTWPPARTVTPAAESTVVLQGTTSATEVYLINSSFELHSLQARALRRLELQVPPGVYRARFQLGSELEDEPLEVGPGERVEVTGGPKVVESAAPLPCTCWPTDPAPPDVQSIWRAAQQPGGDGAGVLTVLLREGEVIAPQEIQLALQGEDQARSLPWKPVAGWQVASLRLPAGTHVLQVSAGDKRLCRAVPVIAGQQTALAIRQVAERDAGDRRLGALLRGALLMAAFPIAGDEEELLRQIVAQQVLERSRALEWPDEQEEESLSPLTLLLRTHGILEARRTHRSHPLDPLELGSAEQDLVRSAYRRLQGTALAGRADVEALAHALGPDEPRRPVNLDVPPLLASTWRTLVTASLSKGGGIRGGLPALRMAEGMMASSLWLTWEARAAPERLGSEAQGILEPELRPGTGLLPSWVGAPKLQQLALRRENVLARGLQLPLPLIQELVHNMEDERAIAREQRTRRRVEALRQGKAKVCLVVLPDGVRVDPARGQPIDFDAVMEELLSDPVERAGMVAVRAPTVRADQSREMAEAIARADVLLVDGTFDSPLVASAITAFQMSHLEQGAAPIVRIQAEEREASAALDDGEVHAYVATYGTGLSFQDPAAFQRAVAAAAGEAPPPAGTQPQGRPDWLDRLAHTEERRIALRALAEKVREKDGEALEAELERAFPAGSLGRESLSIQLDAFLICRAAKSWKGMDRCHGEMADALRRTPLVIEQHALALRWSKQPDALKKAAEALNKVIKAIGLNGETCGLLGGLWKTLWAETNEASYLAEAIGWYHKGVESSPQDPYPGVNLLTLLAAQGTSEALAEHEKLLPKVEENAARRLAHRPSYWDLASMMEVAANKRDRKMCAWFFTRALAAPHDRWQGESTAKNLEILIRSPLAEPEIAADWRRYSDTLWPPRDRPNTTP